MEDNPAIRLYQAWRSFYEFQYNTRFYSSLDQANSLDEVDRSSRIGWYGLQFIYRDFAFAPLCMDANDDPVFAMGRVESGRMQHTLFVIDAQGHFRLGAGFGMYQPKGAYDGLHRFTFIGSDRDYHARSRYDKRIFWVNDPDNPVTYLNSRDWRRHTLYWFEQDVPIAAWFSLKRQGTAWVAEVAPDQGDADWLSDKLTAAYRLATDYYAKWRRTYFRRQGLPDPERRLSPSEIETVNYIAQHVNTYDPPKAYIPSRSEARLLGS